MSLRAAALGLCLMGMIVVIVVSASVVGRDSASDRQLITVVVVANGTPVLYKDCKRAEAYNGVCSFTTDQDEEIQTTFPCAISKVTK